MGWRGGAQREYRTLRRNNGFGAQSAQVRSVWHAVGEKLRLLRRDMNREADKLLTSPPSATLNAA